MTQGRYTRERVFFPFPLKELSKNMKGKHLSMRPVVEALIDEYKETNGESSLKLNNLLMSLMEYHEDLYSFTREDEKELEEELKKLDIRFKPVIEALNELSLNEKKSLFVDSFNNLSLRMRELKDSMHEELLKKEVPEEIEIGMYSFLLYFIRSIESYTSLIEESKGREFEKRLIITNMILVVFSSLITSFFQGTLKIEVLKARLGDLTIDSEPIYRKMSKKVSKALLKVSDVAPIS